MNLKEKILNCLENKNCKTKIIIFMIFLIFFAIFLWKKFIYFLLFLILSLAFYLGFSEYNIDFEKYLQSGNYNISKTEKIKDKSGNNIKLTWECVKKDLDCKNFKTWENAQKIYEKCMNQIKVYNKNISEPKKLDIYGLDRDKDWIACEVLKKK